MVKKILFRVQHSDGSVSVGPEEPVNESYTESYRLIADEGKIITDGENNYSCIDTDEPDKYTEIDEVIEEQSEEDIETEEDE